MRVWITRTRPGAERTARRLAELGLDSLIDPVLAVRRLDVTLDLAGYDALAFTSINAVDAYAALTQDRSLPAYAVGAATAEALTAAGFAQVISANGDVTALAALLRSGRPGNVLHPAAHEPARDLTALAQGVEAVAIYETVAREPADALKAADMSAVLVQSARAGAVLASLGGPGGLPVFAQSAACAAPLAGTETGPVRIAPFPDEPSLLKLCAETMPDARP